ncbi:hypothetical protein HHI36_021488 [Cryptolaemus montrouzieri]|uniref:Uncharacterized protein n=1 Tax=Cryptolaemus montrouzieri TaxID=559131 RepID=A0ABD2MXA7_9CUCU
MAASMSSGDMVTSLIVFWFLVVEIFGRGPAGSLEKALEKVSTKILADVLLSVDKFPTLSRTEGIDTLVLRLLRMYLKNFFLSLLEEIFFSKFFSTRDIHTDRRLENCR